jgi:hypothetical protein
MCIVNFKTNVTVKVEVLPGINFFFGEIPTVLHVISIKFVFEKVSFQISENLI